MSNWVTLSADDLSRYGAAKLVAAMRTKALGAAQPDPLPETIADVCDSIRLEIAACESNVLDATPHAIPRELVRHAAALALEAAQTRLLMDLSEDQRRAADAARAQLRRIAACEVPVSSPDTPEPAPTAQATQPGPAWSGRQRQFSRRQQDGL